MSIVTRTGDKGETGLYGSTRVPKDNPRIDAIGNVDELNALLGCITAEELPDTMKAGIMRIQNTLFTLGADLATLDGSNPNAKRIEHRHVEGMEEWIQKWESVLPPLTAFILPSGSWVGALLHHARTVCRKAERSIVTLGRHETINPQVQIYLNRLSDLLFLLARAANRDAQVEETTVKYE